MAEFCKVMGIVNVTPDSFSDGGKYFRPEEAIRRAHNLAAEGAAIIDFGAESTRPGATPITWQEEWDRLEPVLRGLSPSKEGLSPFQEGLSPSKEGLSPMISVDTYHPETAERAIALGAGMINCVKIEAASEMWDLCAKTHTNIIIPAKSMGTVPKIRGSVSAEKGSVPAEKGSVPTVYIDPMIGFGTTREEDLELLWSLPDLAKKGPVAVGVSRKRIVKKLTGVKVGGKDLAGNLALAAWCALHGASLVRVHDVAETVQLLRVLETLA